MARMCKDKRWESSLKQDGQQEVKDDGTIRITEEDESTKVVKGKHLSRAGTESDINGTCDHGNADKSFIQLRRREQRQMPEPHTVTIHYSGELIGQDEDIAKGRYRVTGGIIDPEEGTWVATTPGGDIQDEKEKEKKEKKEKEKRDASGNEQRYGA